MWLIRFILNLFKKEETPEVKSNNVGAFVMKIHNKTPSNNNKNTWTGPYRKR